MSPKALEARRKRLEKHLDKDDLTPTYEKHRIKQYTEYHDDRKRT